MSAFTYDDWNVLVAEYRNKIGVDQNINTTRRTFANIGFERPWYVLNVADVNTFLYNMALAWCPSAAGSVDTTRVFWSQATLDEIDSVMSGGRCGSGDLISFFDRGNVSIPIINTQTDPVFPGRTRFNFMAFDVEALNTITWPEEYFGRNVEVYYTANFTRSPAPNLIWTNIRVRSNTISTSGKTNFVNDTVDAILLIYNVTSYNVAAKYRVIG